MEATLGIAFVGLFCAAVVALVVVLIVHSARRERERKAAIAQWAASRGWTVSMRPIAVDWTTQLPGRNRRGVSMLVSGTVSGWPVGVAEYSYTTTSTTGTGTSQSTSSTTHHFIVTTVRLDAPYPPIAVQPRGALSKLGRSIFGDNAAATGQPAFDQQFKVMTKDPAYSRSMVGPALIGEHLAGRVPGWSLTGHDLVTWQSGRLRDPSQIETLAAHLVRVIGLLGR